MRHTLPGSGSHTMPICPQAKHSKLAASAPVLQAGGVPVFIRLLRDDDIALVTAAAGTLHCLVQDHQAYVNWVRGGKLMHSNVPYCTIFA